MTRHELYQRFGAKLLEAIVLIIKDELNILRVKAGLSERTNEQLINVIGNKLSQVTNYDWMNNENNDL